VRVAGDAVTGGRAGHSVELLEVRRKEPALELRMHPAMVRLDVRQINDFSI
jgi:hypothetical protein